MKQESKMQENVVVMCQQKPGFSDVFSSCYYDLASTHKTTELSICNAFEVRPFRMNSFWKSMNKMRCV